MDTDSSENSSSEYSSTDSSEDDGMETADILGVKLQIPQGLCERLEIFKEVISTETWNSLSERHRQHLQQFLPDFPENDLEEKNRTLQDLFDFSDFRFGDNPLQLFHEHLKAGYFRPDIAKMRHLIRKSQQRESRYRYKMMREKLKTDLIESQRKMLNQVRHLPPGAEPKSEKTCISNVDRISHITKKRYFQVLSTIRAKSEDMGFSSDENYPDGPPSHLSRKQKRHLNSLKNHILSNEKLVISSTTVKQNGLDLDEYVTSSYNPFYINEDMYKSMIVQHKRRKIDHDSSPELNTKGINIVEVINRTQLPYIKTTPIVTNKHHIEHKITSRKKLKKEMLDNVKSSFVGHSSNSDDSDSDSYVDAVSVTNSIKNRHKPSKFSKPPPKIHIPPKPKPEIKKETPEIVPLLPPESPPAPVSSVPKTITSFPQYGKPLTLSELEGIDMMNIPIDLDNSDIDILELNNKPELMQETHSNFLSLIRDVICSTPEHRMNLKSLEDRLKSWQENPISPLNDWYSLSDNWLGLLASAIDFLCGNSPDVPEDFVPYMEHKVSLDIYQWIGAGRDSDSLLLPLCQYWLDHRSDNKVENKDDIDVEVSDRSHSPPPPRCPTTWTVRKASAEEIKDFQEQERKRYNNPHKAFTYRCHGYESVVGPLKGIYNPNNGSTKARGHSMLTADRPNFVTILSLVRDATARLPNGEGTRADICELLKCSQYISSTAADSVLQTVVSGALDRMHTQFDPCVKYDPKRKIWIYLHRNRTEDDFERIHQQCQGMNKVPKKPTSKKTPSKGKQKQEKTLKVLKPEPAAASQIAEKVKQMKEKLANRQPSPTPLSSQNTITPPAPPKPPSLLLQNNVQNITDHPPTPSLQRIDSPSNTSHSPILSQEDKEISTAIQAIVQNRVSSPISKQLLKGTKGLVKIISPSQGKSLIIPANPTQALKQDKIKQAMAQSVSQQIIQSSSAQPQKQTIQIIQKASDDKTLEQKIKVPVTMQQQIIQSISPQQFQNIKNVTLLRSVSNPGSGVPSIVPISQNSEAKVTTLEGKAAIQQDHLIPSNIQIKTPTTLTAAQQQQIFQTIKQKILPQTTILTPQQQQIILKQKAASALQKQNQIAPGTSLLGQPKVTDGTKAAISSSQPPVVAKLLTNAAGQVISVENLLTHQKQQGTLPQGATLRVTSGKGGQTNVIQLTTAGAASAKQSAAIAQFAVASQNNLIALSSQPKLVVASQPATVVTSSLTAAAAKPVSRAVAAVKQQPQPVAAKFSPKVAQQLVNAKIITQGLDGQAKLIMGQTGNPVKISAAAAVGAGGGGGKGVAMPKAVTLSVAANTANTIRMVNATNLNLTHIGGKPVLLAGKGNTLQNIQGQNVILQAQPNAAGQQQLVLQNASTVKTLPASASAVGGGGGLNLLGSQNVVLAAAAAGSQTHGGGQVVRAGQQTQPQVVFGQAARAGAAGAQAAGVGATGGQHIMLGGHPVRLQAGGAAGAGGAGQTGAQRVVLASQGQGGQIVAQQILLPAGFQGAAINIKALQGVKVIPIAQAHAQARGIQGRQVFARVMSPSMVKSPQTPSSSNSNPSSTSNSSNDKITIDSVITSND